MADLDSAIAAAVSSAEAEAGGSAGDTPADTGSGQAVVPDSGTVAPSPDTPAATPAVTAKPAAATPAATDEPDPDESLVPSAADLERINANPDLLKVYKSMQRGLTQKTQKLATDRKSMEERANVADWIQKDPDNAIRALAQARGLTIAEAKREAATAVETQVVDDLTAKWEKTLGKDAAIQLRPLIEETAAAVAKQLLGPTAERAEALSKAAAERGLSAAVREFEAGVVARGETFPDDVQDEMAALMDTVSPTEREDENGNIVQAPVDEYLAALHDMVMARRSRKGAIKAQLTRIKEAAAAGIEPSTTGSRAPGNDDVVPLGLTENEMVERAVSIATRRMQAQR